MHRSVGDRESLGQVGGCDHDRTGGEWRGGSREVARIDRVGAVLGSELLDTMLLPRHDQHATLLLALVERLAHEGVDASDVAFHATPPELCRGHGAIGRLSHQLE